MNLNDLLRRTPQTLSEVARRANVDWKTAKRAMNGERISRAKIVALLHQLNMSLGENHSIDEIDQPMY